MGSKSAAAQRRRARQRHRRLARAERAARAGAVTSTRRATLAVAEVRNALRARERAMRAAVLAEQRAGAALSQLGEEGFTLRQAGSRCGLSVQVVRRLLALAVPAQALDPLYPSTEMRPPDASHAAHGDGPIKAGPVRP